MVLGVHLMPRRRNEVFHDPSSSAAEHFYPAAFGISDCQLPIPSAES